VAGAEKTLSKRNRIGANIMIFITVGTHEDPFDRLVKAIDTLKKEQRITQEVFIQTGYSKYQPQYCQYKAFVPFEEMTRRMAESDMVITHGGTGSIMLILYHQKIPIVVPRKSEFHEHIDDHQVLFCQTMADKGKIIPVYDTLNLEKIINDYPEQALHILARQISNSNQAAGTDQLKQKSTLFAEKINTICKILVEK
jgi:UDP-N-acetylglucosamine transferase subunit ALG13